MNPVIETPRLILSPYRAEDADAMVLNAGEPRVARMMASIPLPFTRERALARITKAGCDDRRFVLAIRDRETGEAIGEIGAGAREGAVAQFGYFLRPDFWGRGLMAEAVPAALDHAFGTLNWPMIEADALDENPASARVLLRAGFEPMGASTCTSVARDDTPMTTFYRLLRMRWVTPTLPTARLTLRPPRMTDAPRIAPLIGAPEVMRMITSLPMPYTLADAEEWLSGSLSNPNDVTCAIDDGTGLIGIASLSHVEPGVRSFGFWLGTPYWGGGLMSEAVNALLAWGFGPGGLDRIESSAFMDNIASRRIHAKLGFVEGAETTLTSSVRDGPAPGILMSLIRQDWTPIP